VPNINFDETGIGQQLLMGLAKSSESVLLLDDLGQMRWSNAGLIELLGHHPAENELFEDLLLPEQGAWRPRDFVRALRTKRSFHGRLLVRRTPRTCASDARDSCWLRASLIPLESCPPLGFALLLQDITQEVVRESLERSRARTLELRTRLLQILEQPVLLQERLDDVLRYLSSLSEVTGATRMGAFFSRVLGHDSLQLRASVSLRDEELEILRDFLSLGRGIPELVGSFDQIQSYFDVSALSVEGKPGICESRSYGLLAIPCMSEGELMGLLCLYTSSVMLTELHVQEMLWELGESCALAIAKDLLRDQIHEARITTELGNQLKSRFLANITHELRTPLNGIIGIAALLEQTDLDGDQRELVETVDRSSQALLNIVDEILEFGRIESAALRIERRPFDLVSRMRDSIQLVTPEAKRKQLLLDWDIDPRLVGVRFMGDGGRLQQVFVNLLGNAIKFTDQGGVRLSASMRLPVAEGPGHLIFVVEDSGIGIPREQLDHVFASFVQLDGSSSRRAGGTGLGLTISKAIVERMGGEIWVESEPGKGSRFGFELVAEEARADAEPDAAGEAR
jgi:signal transduction histidine kinase